MIRGPGILYFALDILASSTKPVVLGIKMFLSISATQRVPQTTEENTADRQSYPKAKNPGGTPHIKFPLISLPSSRPRIPRLSCKFPKDSARKPRTQAEAKSPHVRCDTARTNK